MDKKIKIVPVAVTLVTLGAITTAFAFSKKPKVEPGSLPTTVTPVATHIAQQGKADVDGEEKDGEEKDDGPLTAKITPDAAKAAALAAQPGTAGKTELEDEDGTTVYGVEVTAADGKKYDVKVNANTGRALKSEADDENEGEDGEKDDDAK